MDNPVECYQITPSPTFWHTVIFGGPLATYAISSMAKNGTISSRGQDMKAFKYNRS